MWTHKVLDTVTWVEISWLSLSDKEILSVESETKEVTFTLQIHQTGVTELEAWFLDDTGERQGAYYVYVERVG